MSGRGGFRGAGRGRGAYYKNLYGRGDRIGSGAQSNKSAPDTETSSTDDTLSRGPAALGGVTRTHAVLQQELNRLDGKSYGAYKDLKGVSHKCVAETRGMGVRDVSVVSGQDTV
jgi:hypothetical protein